MHRLQGKTIVATDALNDTYFDGSVIFITEQNSNGAAGFIINRLLNRKLNELEEFSNTSPIDIYEGGPVGNEHLYFIHTSSFPGGEKINDNIYFGGDFTKAVTLLSNGTLSLSQVKIFIGYCGWNSGELEAEIEEGSWHLDDSSLSKIFDHTIFI